MDRSDTAGFLRRVLPRQGWLCAAKLERGARNTWWRNQPVADVEELAVRVAAINAAKCDAYMALAGYRERERVHDDPAKAVRGVTRFYRTQENAGWLRSLWLDIDVKPDRDDAYPTRDAASKAITQFLRDTKLPWPLPVAQRMHTLDTHHEWRAASLYLHEPGTFVPLARLDEKLVEPAFLATGTDGGFVQVAAKTRHAMVFYQNDHLGTPQELVDASGKVVWLARYRAWGRAKSTPYGKTDPTEADNRIRFQGQYHDEETGLAYNRHRYYDPGTGRFISKDPIGLAGGVNVFQYAPNPIGWVDPLGLSNTFPSNPDDMSKLLGVDPKIGTTPDGTPRYTWTPNSNTRIRYESHPEGLCPCAAGFNPRHHGEHYHVETKPDGLTWGQASRQGLVTKSKPNGYTPGSGTGFVPGESFPGL